MKLFTTIIIQLSLLMTLLVTTGCNENTGVDLSYQEGRYPDYRKIRNFCINPRVGKDIFGRSYNDRQGTLLHELQYLRAWSNDTYLWYDEIIDQNPITFNDPIKYFNTLKTEQLTPTGNPKDNFHFSTDTESYLLQTQSGVSSGYGLEWALISSSPPRELRVAFSEPNGPAAAQNLTRGAEVLEIDGVDLINAGTAEEVDILNAGINPSSPGETHTFLVRDLGATEPRLITMTSATVSQSAILANQVIATNTGNVAYVVYNTFRAFSEQALVDTFNQLATQNIQDLILDLRYNRGGLLDLASELSYMIAGDAQTDGNIFDRIIFNDKHPNIDPVTGAPLTATPFYSQSTGAGVLPVGTSLPSLNLNRVFILSTGSTCSASEAVINGLTGINVEVILIGDSTCGKPYGFYPTDNCGTTYFTIQLTGVNNQGFGEYPDGFTPENSQGPLGVLLPGCSVGDDFEHAFADPEEALLKQALNYRETGVCDAPTITKGAQTAEEKSAGLELSIKKSMAEKILVRSK